jgi:hypothetical protein
MIYVGVYRFHSLQEFLRVIGERRIPRIRLDFLQTLKVAAEFGGIHRDMDLNDCFSGEFHYQSFRLFLLDRSLAKMLQSDTAIMLNTNQSKMIRKNIMVSPIFGPVGDCPGWTVSKLWAS